jgi:hypothetical protein
MRLTPMAFFMNLLEIYSHAQPTEIEELAKGTAPSLRLGSTHPLEP